MLAWCLMGLFTQDLCSKEPFVKPPHYGPRPTQIVLIYRTVHYKGPEPGDPASARLTDGFKIVNVGMGFDWTVHVTSDTVKHNIKLHRYRTRRVEFPPLSGNYVILVLPNALYSFSYDTKDQNYELRVVDNWDTEMPTNTHYPVSAYQDDHFGTVVVEWENEILAGIMEEEGVSRYKVADFGYKVCGEMNWGPFYYACMHKLPDRLVGEDGLILENWESPESDRDSSQDNLVEAQNGEHFEELHPAFNEGLESWDPAFLDEALTDKEQQREANREAMNESERAWNDLRMRALRGDFSARSFGDLLNYFPAPASEEFARKSTGFNPGYAASREYPDGIPLWAFQLGYGDRIQGSPYQEFTHAYLISANVNWRQPWLVDAYRHLHDWITAVITEETKPQLDQATGDITMKRPDRISDIRAEQRERTQEVTGSQIETDDRDHADGTWWAYRRCADMAWALATRLAWHDPSVDPVTYNCETGR